MHEEGHMASNINHVGVAGQGQTVEGVRYPEVETETTFVGPIPVKGDLVQESSSTHFMCCL